MLDAAKLAIFCKTKKGFPRKLYRGTPNSEGHSVFKRAGSIDKELKK